MPKFEGPYKVLEIKGNNLVIWKNGRNITVNIDQVRVYRPRQSDTISSDSPIETLYDEQEVSHGSNRSHQGQFKEHRKTSSQETIKRSKICRKRSRQGSDHQDRKRHAHEQRQESRGRSLPRSRPGLTNFRDLIPLHQEYSPLQVHQSCLIAGQIRLQVDPEWKLVDVITRPVRPERQREDTTKKRKTVRSNQTNTRRPCPYYLQSRIQEKTESMRTSTTSKSTAYLAAYSAEEASVWKR
ncbi:hypothetical protein TNCV_2526921 [Trichonephila clavipes]|nr:hypothetical protein TNCV_2526921 [Trichonephila clavipes]